MKRTNKKNDRLFAAYASATVSAVLCCLLLAFTVLDGECYKEEDSVPTSITFTAPEKPEKHGFWDIFSEAVIHLFHLEG